MKVGEGFVVLKTTFLQSLSFTSFAVDNGCIGSVSRPEQYPSQKLITGKGLIVIATKVVLPLCYSTNNNGTGREANSKFFVGFCSPYPGYCVVLILSLHCTVLYVPEPFKKRVKALM